jgi:phospholipid/cholesterol/gamma-HCH transport system substrate-binding protein
MKPKRFTDLKVGITILTGIVVLALFLMLVGTREYLFSGTQSFRVFFTDVNGLTRGSLVTLNGYKVGRVEDMELSQRDGHNGIVALLSVDASQSPRITTSSRVVVKTTGMLGDKYLDITMGSPDEPPVQPGGFLPSLHTAELSDAMAGLAGMADSLRALVNDAALITHDVQSGRGVVGSLLKDNTMADNLAQTIRSLRNASNALEHRKGTLARLLNDNELYVDLASAAHSLHGMADSLRCAKGTLGRLVREDSLYVSILSTSRNLDAITARLGNGNSSIGAALNDRELYMQLSSALRSLDSLAADIRQNPSRYIHLSLF